MSGPPWDLGILGYLRRKSVTPSPRHSVTTPGIDNVVHGIAGRHTFGLRNLTNALRAEGAFRVDVDHLSRQTPPVLPGTWFLVVSMVENEEVDKGQQAQSRGVYEQIM